MRLSRPLGARVTRQEWPRRGRGERGRGHPTKPREVNYTGCTVIKFNHIVQDNIHAFSVYGDWMSVTDRKHL